MPVPREILDTIDYYRTLGLDDKAITDKMIAANLPGISQTVSMYQNKGFSPDMILERMRQPNEGAGPGATPSMIQPGDLIAGAVPGVAGAVRKGAGKLAEAANVMLPRVAQAGGRIAGSVATHLPLGASPIGSETPKVTYQEIGRILAGKEGNTGSLTDILKNAGRKVFGGEAPPAPATVNPQAESVVQNALRRPTTSIPATAKAPQPIVSTPNPAADIMRNRTMNMAQQQAEKEAEDAALQAQVNAGVKNTPATLEGGLQPPVRTPAPQQPSSTLGGPESPPTNAPGQLPEMTPQTSPTDLEQIMQARAAQVPGINAATPPAPGAPTIEDILAGSKSISPELAGQYGVTPESQALDLKDMLSLGKTLQPMNGPLVRTGNVPAMPLSMKDILQARMAQYGGK